MATPLDALFDHVAVAVPDLDHAQGRWRERLAGRPVAWEEAAGFRSYQLRYNGGGKVELLAPPVHAGADNFVVRFLTRFGVAPHHVTLKVPSLGVAIRRLQDVGLDVVDVRQEDPHWHEAFLRPSQIGGLVVQIASSDESDEAWAARLGHVPEPPPPDGAMLSALVLTHPDLAAAQELWSLLGADVQAGPDGLVAAWPRSPIGLVIRQGATAGPVSLLFAGTEPQPAEDGVGPAIEVVSTL